MPLEEGLYQYCKLDDVVPGYRDEGDDDEGVGHGQLDLTPYVLVCRSGSHDGRLRTGGRVKMRNPALDGLKLKVDSGEDR